MKVLCVIDSLGSGGAQRQLVNLAIGFKEKGCDVSFLVYHCINFFKNELEEKDILVHEIIESNYLKRLYKMRQHIRKGGFDAVLSFLEAPSLICEIAGLPWRKWKLVVGERSANPAMLKSFKYRLYRWFHVFADYIVANSHMNLEMVYHLNPLLPKAKGKVIYNMIDLNLWKYSSKYVPFKDNKFNLIVAASFGDVKNLYGLIEAVNLLPDKYKSKLKIKWYGHEHIVGYLEKAHEKIKYLKIDKCFLFLPPSHEIMSHMSCSDAVGLFSHYEGLPNAICEGMALGKPVISTNISDLPLIVKYPDLLADPSSPESIAATLKYYIDLPKEKLIEEGKCNRLKAEAIFNKEVILDKYINILQKS